MAELSRRSLFSAVLPGCLPGAGPSQAAAGAQAGSLPAAQGPGAAPRPARAAIVATTCAGPTFLGLEELGCAADGAYRPVSQWLAGQALDRGYQSLDEIRRDYPRVASLDDAIDWTLIQGMVDLAGRGGSVTLPPGDFLLNRPLDLRERSFQGAGGGTHLHFREVSPELDLLLLKGSSGFPLRRTGAYTGFSVTAVERCGRFGGWIQGGGQILVEGVSFNETAAGGLLLSAAGDWGWLEHTSLRKVAFFRPGDVGIAVWMKGAAARGGARPRGNLFANHMLWQDVEIREASVADIDIWFDNSDGTTDQDNVQDLTLLNVHADSQRDSLTRHSGHAIRVRAAAGSRSQIGRLSLIGCNFETGRHHPGAREPIGDGTRRLRSVAVLNSSWNGYAREPLDRTHPAPLFCFDQFGGVVVRNAAVQGWSGTLRAADAGWVDLASVRPQRLYELLLVEETAASARLLEERIYIPAGNASRVDARSIRDGADGAVAELRVEDGSLQLRRAEGRRGVLRYTLRVAADWAPPPRHEPAG